METSTVVQECVSARSILSVTESLTAQMKQMKKIAVSFILCKKSTSYICLYKISFFKCSFPQWKKSVKQNMLTVMRINTAWPKDTYLQTVASDLNSASRELWEVWTPVEGSGHGWRVCNSSVYIAVVPRLYTVNGSLQLLTASSGTHSAEKK